MPVVSTPATSDPALQLVPPLVPPSVAAAVPAPSVSAPAAPPAPPAAQVAQAVVHLAASPAASQITVELNPGSLGRVQVQIDRSSQGLAHITLTAERPETLALLQGDQKQLDAALTRSGLSELGRTISFHAAPADLAPRDPSTTPLASGAGSNAGFAGSGSGASTMPDRQEARGGSTQSFVWTAPSADTADAVVSASAPSLSRQRLDITA